MLRTKATKATGSKKREGEFSEPDTRMVFAVLAIGVIVGAMIMPGRSPASAKAKSPAPVSASVAK